MEAENKQNSVIEFIESVNADDKNSTRVISQPTSETEEHTEINLELSLGGCYSENKSSSEGGSNVGPRVGITERSNPNASDIVKDARLAARNDAFLEATSIMNWEIYRRTLLQSIVHDQLACKRSYPDPEGFRCLAPINGVKNVNMITQRPPRWEAQDLVRTRCPAQTRKQNRNIHTASAKIRTCTPGRQSATRVPTELRHGSCMPNCYARIMSTSEEDNHIILVAKTSVSAGTELTYDYRFTGLITTAVKSLRSPANEDLQSAGSILTRTKS